jgi:hypothetical protein
MTDMPVVSERAFVCDKPEVTLVFERNEMPHRTRLISVVFLVTACLATLLMWPPLFDSD